MKTVAFSTLAAKARFQFGPTRRENTWQKVDATKAAPLADGKKTKPVDAGTMVWVEG